MHRAAVRAFADLVAVHAVQPSATGLRAVGVLVGERRRMAAGVPFLTSDHAGLAANAGVEVDHQAEPPGRASRGAGWSSGLAKLLPVPRGRRPRRQTGGRASGANSGARPGFGRRRALDTHPQVVPGRLTGTGSALA